MAAFALTSCGDEQPGTPRNVVTLPAPNMAAMSDFFMAALRVGYVPVQPFAFSM
jgi:hypothetical protein